MSSAQPCPAAGSGARNSSSGSSTPVEPGKQQRGAVQGRSHRTLSHTERLLAATELGPKFVQKTVRIGGGATVLIMAGIVLTRVIKGVRQYHKERERKTAIGVQERKEEGAEAATMIKSITSNLNDRQMFKLLALVGAVGAHVTLDFAATMSCMAAVERTVFLPLTLIADIASIVEYCKAEAGKGAGQGEEKLCSEKKGDQKHVSKEQASEDLAAALVFNGQV